MFEWRIGDFQFEAYPVVGGGDPFYNVMCYHGDSVGIECDPVFAYSVPGEMPAERVADDSRYKLQGLLRNWSDGVLNHGEIKVRK